MAVLTQNVSLGMKRKVRSSCCPNLKLSMIEYFFRWGKHSSAGEMIIVKISEKIPSIGLHYGNKSRQLCVL